MPAEKRRQRRDFCASHVLITKWGNGKDFDILTARCSDVGPAGMCIYTSFELEPGSFLKIKGHKGMAQEQLASVRWVEKLDWNLFRAGLSFM
ncbi:MAG: hypothetical protein P8Y85_02785 [Nitrospirota bacterium]|jgi:hypothetical protein